jgi:hypothetical protein
VILPGFPTSAIFTFHEFVAPVIRAFAGLPAEQAGRLAATLPMRIASERGRTEYLMVSLVRGGDGEGPLAAYPNSKGSGAVTIGALSRTVAGDLSLCMPSSMHWLLTAPMTSAVKAKFPDIRLRLTDGFDHLSRAQLKSRSADLGVIVYDPRHKGHNAVTGIMPHVAENRRLAV